ncbi:MAG: tRNA-dihydrouridine synthase family protein [Bdellovibrionaceae bacterium]|nr:tRNA-dihydrouridine synthase family protein [Bdellovibrio sp.]
MVGLSHVALRRLISDYMPQNASTHWPTEMLNSRRVPGENLKTTPETLRRDEEVYLVPQILGNEEIPIQKAVQRLVNEWGASGIDINMGCPVQKALKHNYGVSLMGDVNYAAQVVAMTKKVSTVPVSVKLRAVGSEKSVPQLITFVQQLVDSGADWITLHPRTAAQKRRGQSDWSQIAELKKAVKIPIIGNGDIQTADDVVLMINETGADKVMAGRALAARPWMMWQLGEKLGFASAAHLHGRRAPHTPVEEGAEYGRSLLKLIEYSEESFMQVAGASESLTLRKMQFYIRTTHVWLEFGHTLMAMCSRAQNLSDLKIQVACFFEHEQAMYPRTELRQ